jgi:hypothetical protein
MLSILYIVTVFKGSTFKCLQDVFISFRKSSVIVQNIDMWLRNWNFISQRSAQIIKPHPLPGTIFECIESNNDTWLHQ